jgi:acyl-CoA:acyl-CoA alkyltransferase
MTSFEFNNVRIYSMATVFPKTILTSGEVEDSIVPIYEKLKIPFGTLERLSGVKNRYIWPRSVAPSEAGAEVVKNALAEISFDPKLIGAIISCSVCRDYFEPSTACLIHQRLELSEEITAFDITNACIGFSNGLITVASMIESGQINAGIVVSAENPAIILDSQRKLVNERAESLTREDLIKLLPTFTLGAGAVCYVLTNSKLAPEGHKLLGGVGLSATAHSELCKGNGDFCLMGDEGEVTPVMETESTLLIQEAAKLGRRTWGKLSENVGWEESEISHIVCHQVGRQVNEYFYKEMGLDFRKDYSIFKHYGNMISAAMPSALALGSIERSFKKGEKVLTTAFGSGLNSLFLSIEW